jgi:hypothetical protein
MSERGLSAGSRIGQHLLDPDGRDPLRRRFVIAGETLADKSNALRGGCPAGFSALGHEPKRSRLEVVKDLLQPCDTLVEPQPGSSGYGPSLTRPPRTRCAGITRGAGPPETGEWLLSRHVCQCAAV